MSSRKKLIADLLFGVQIVGASVFCGAYLYRSIYDVTGSSLVQFALAAIYLLFHLALGMSAHKMAPSRVTRQAVATYAIWLVLFGGVIFAAATNPAYRWSEGETAQLQTASLLTVMVLVVVVVQRRKFSYPMIKAFFAIAYKSVPQLLLVWKFMAEGATGLPGLSVLVGHITIIIRLGQIYFMVREAGWDRNRVWLAISETANELSWIAATTAWLLI